MSEWRFISDKKDEEYPGMERLLFSRSQHMELNQGGRPHYFHLLKRDRLMASVSFQIKDKLASSPAFAPYSGFQVSREISLMNLSEFIDEVENTLRAESVNKMVIRSLPEGIASYPVATANYLLINKGYRVADSALHSILDITDSRGTGFDQNYWKKIEKSGHLIFSWESADSSAEIHDFILQCRKERSQEFSMGSEDFQNHMNGLPGKFLVASLRDEGRLAAVMTLIKLDTHMVYDFAHAHSREYDSISPVIRLTKEVAMRLAESGSKYLDLGSSSLQDGPNFSLIDFKQNLGGRFYRKDCFEKTL